MVLVLASHNKSKIKEIQLVIPKTFQLLSLDDVGCTTAIPETGNTIEENAILKAQYITEKYRCNCFSDDSGLEVEALNGAPGVFSARYAGEPSNDEDNIEKLLDELKNVVNRTAYFKTIICLYLNNKHYLFEGTIKGKITEKRIGTNGFGYDAVFMPDGYTKTFAELTINQKATISHRGIAIKKLVHFLSSKCFIKNIDN